MSDNRDRIYQMALKVLIAKAMQYGANVDEFCEGAIELLSRETGNDFEAIAQAAIAIEIAADAVA